MPGWLSRVPVNPTCPATRSTLTWSSSVSPPRCRQGRRSSPYTPRWSRSTARQTIRWVSSNAPKSNKAKQRLTLVLPTFVRIVGFFGVTVVVVEALAVESDMILGLSVGEVCYRRYHGTAVSMREKGRHFKAHLLVGGGVDGTRSWRVRPNKAAFYAFRRSLGGAVSPPSLGPSATKHQRAISAPTATKRVDVL